MASNKAIINFCPTGMVPVKEMTQHVPVHPEEIIEQTHEAYELGITIVHLHARDKDETPTWKKNIYRTIIEGVKKHCPDLVICASTSGRLYSDFERRSEVIELQPDMCSLTLSSLNFPNQASVNSPDVVQKLAKKMQEYGVHPELECFDLGMINYGKYLIKKGFLEPPFYWNLLFGNVAGFQASFSQIGTAINEIPKDHYFALAGLGRDQMSVCGSAIAMGLGVRMGLEDNIWLDRDRTTLATNTQLLKRVHQLLDIHDFEYLPSNEFGEYGFYNNNR